MRRLSDEEIVGLYAPRGLAARTAEGGIRCARGRCTGTGAAEGRHAYRWVPRYDKRAPIEICARCHKELATIISGG